ncbi:MAG: hypothetical protein VX293_02680 [Candidatus Latescibacterota bacterium]|nr:hypothetical protein [Candidatus Latescibacterota bacterium]
MRDDDLSAVEALIDEHPELMGVHIRSRSWGPPLSHAANLGKLEIIKALMRRNPEDIEQAFGRATLQGQLDVTRFLLEQKPELGRDLKFALFGPCGALNAEAIPFLIALDADPNAIWENGGTPLDMAICTYTHKGRPACIEALVQGGVDYEDGPEMDIHRRRVDLLTARLDADLELVYRPSAFRAGKEYGGLYGGAPLIRPTRLHICAEFGAVEEARLLIERGANPDARCLPDADGIGDQTPIFHAVAASESHAFLVLELLVEKGADFNARATVRVPRAGLQSVQSDDPVLENATPLGYALNYPNSLHHKPHEDAVAFLRGHGGIE